MVVSRRHLGGDIAAAPFMILALVVSSVAMSHGAAAPMTVMADSGRCEAVPNTRMHSRQAGGAHGGCAADDSKTERIIAAGDVSCDATGQTDGSGESCPSSSSESADRGGDVDDDRGDAAPEGASAVTTTTEFLRDRYIVRFNDYRMVRTRSDPGKRGAGSEGYKNEEGFP